MHQAENLNMATGNERIAQQEPKQIDVGNAEYRYDAANTQEKNGKQMNS